MGISSQAALSLPQKISLGIVSTIGSDVAEASAYLQRGELVAIPTETVYGLAANALDAEAVAAIFAAKNRPTFDPLILHVPSLAAASRYVTEIPETAQRLADAFWPGPLTLLFPKKPLVPDLVTAGLPTVAVRVPAHPLTLALLEALDFPLAAPSANPFGYISPTTPQHVAAQLGELVPYILDGGPCEIGIESTIVSLQGERPKVVRLGGLSVEAIEDVVGPVATTLHSSSSPLAPGMLKSHYAPQKPLFLMDTSEAKSLVKESDVAYLFFEKTVKQPSPPNVFYLSKKGDYKEAAQRLFGYLRQLDAGSWREIRAELLPERDLGRAINDRLRRAAHRENELQL